MPILHGHPTDSKIAYIGVDFKQFGEVQEYFLQGWTKVYPSSPQMPYVAPPSI